MESKTPKTYIGPSSDHFDGKHFFNRDPYKTKTIFDMIKWHFRQNKIEWPKHLTNPPHSPVIQITDPKQLRVTFINHATLLIQSEKVNILTDPIWSHRASPFKSLGPERERRCKHILF